MSATDQTRMKHGREELRSLLRIRAVVLRPARRGVGRLAVYGDLRLMSSDPQMTQIFADSNLTCLSESAEIGVICG
jgi:hypothetical protein